MMKMPTYVPQNLSFNRIADVFMSESSPELKEMVISHFVQENGIARVVFCTEAFGMGLDCPDIAQVIHFSPAKDY
jgi:superfamily II DNA helicase RecQ